MIRFKFKNYLIRPSMTLEVKLHVMKDLHLYDVIIHKKF